MDLRELRSRLDTIKKRTEDVRPAGKVSDKTLGSEAELLEHGWQKTADMVYERAVVQKNILPEVVSNILLDDKAPKEGVSASRFIFYDTETTGLSAGAGNMVFLAGFGELQQLPKSSASGSEFNITQIFLSDFPGEPAFLERLQDFILPERIYVSYNGKSFDANVLNSRFTMNGMKADFGYQLDLLYSSRRLWKNIIGSCSLGDIERRVLDKHRKLDVPGFMVPDLYFDFIRVGSWDAIEGVIAHHLEDISSLTELLVVHEQLFAEAEKPAASHPEGWTEFYDPLGLAALLADKRPNASMAVLQQSWSRGSNHSGIELSLMLKRSDRRSDAVTIWKQLWDEGHSVFAGIELAKYYEHHVHDIQAALEITEAMLSLKRFRIISYRDELEKRKNRLLTKKDKT